MGLEPTGPRGRNSFRNYLLSIRVFSKPPIVTHPPGETARVGAGLELGSSVRARGLEPRQQV
jgi:hypothetical protein